VEQETGAAAEEVIPPVLPKVVTAAEVVVRQVTVKVEEVDAEAVEGPEADEVQNVEVEVQDAVDEEISKATADHPHQHPHQQHPRPPTHRTSTA
jgi:DNA-directed RNA polymerase beta' subunit